MTAGTSDEVQRVAGPTALRDRTEQAVLDVVFAEPGPVTRVDIAGRTGLSKPTVNAAVRRLEHEGVLAPAGLQTGRQGRVATLYELADTAGAVVAVELNPGVIRVAVSDLLGRQVSVDRFDPPRSPEDVADQLERIVVEAGEHARRERTLLRAAAISVAKPVDPRTLSVIELPDTPYPEGLVQPAEILAARISAPLLVDNDVNLAALGEQRNGVAKDVDDFAYLYVGAGLGLGVVVDGRLVRGSRGLAGEIGYLPSRADTSGEQHGLARAVSGFGLGPRRRDAWYLDTVAEARSLLRAAEDGDRHALDAVAHAARALGEAATAICAILDPGLIVLGGPIGTNALLRDELQRTLDDLAPAPTPVAASALGESAPLQGALELARRHARDNL
ncbi:ROK family transcriptional regulator [Pseudonocardia nigra]|uniref:ROK family transcriptional regulator n=1 Tax=Pseudonocardia nigra TaxID=1921578 RepID=UPI001C5D6D9E|nr:ROK family transcriptional regulator [Pseudonocardia nigra]